jgi:hypothetical protein
MNPNTLKVDGTCPTCGTKVAEPGEETEPGKAPWHFKLLVALTVVYLGWRLIQMATWVLT